MTGFTLLVTFGFIVTQTVHGIIASPKSYILLLKSTDVRFSALQGKWADLNLISAETLTWEEGNRGEEEEEEEEEERTGASGRTVDVRISYRDEDMNKEKEEEEGKELTVWAWGWVSHWQASEVKKKRVRFSPRERAAWGSACVRNEKT